MRKATRLSLHLLLIESSPHRRQGIQLMVACFLYRGPYLDLLIEDPFIGELLCIPQLTLRKFPSLTRKNSHPSFGQALLIHGLRDVGLGKLGIKFSAGRLFMSVGERSQSRDGSPSSYTDMGRAFHSLSSPLAWIGVSGSARALESENTSPV
ncbi:hypothetical protein Salat_2358000 [Sesamum alatum]|uniref:Uncharacterized protein n=1 Tax=Sesamum alatum TaxID=300844 RepID=A0AAE2CER6_9LAMI|nr:hypothetical protein Salat_2358000 [Sesamum alatum]